jgi:hypothetical protein
MPLVLLILALVCAFIPLAGGGTAARAASPAAASVQFSQNPVPSGTAVTVTGCGFGTVAQGSVSYSVFLGSTLVAGPSTPTITPTGSGDCFTFTLSPPTAPNAYTVSVTADGVTASNVLQVNPTTPAPSVTFAPNPAPANVNVTATLCNLTANPGTVSVLVTNSAGGVVTGPTNYNVTPAPGMPGCYTFSLVSPTQGGAYTVTVTGGTGANSFTAAGTLNVSTTTPPGTSLTVVSPVVSGSQQTATICGFPAGLTSVSVTITSNTTGTTVSSAPASVTATGTAGCYTFTLIAPVPIDTYTVTVTGGGTSASATLVVNTGVGGLQFVPNPASPNQTVTANNVCGFQPGLSVLNVAITSQTTGQTVFNALVPVTSTNGAGCYTLSFSAPSLPDSYTVAIGRAGVTVVSGTLVVSSAFVPGTLTLSPNVASPGSTVVASGCGYNINDVLTLTIFFFANAFNQVAATPTIISSPVFTGGGINGSLCVSVSFTVPNLPSGTYTVTLSGSVSGTVNSGTLTITNGVCVGCCVGLPNCCTTISCCVGLPNCCVTCGCLTITTATGTVTCAASLTASPSTVVAGGSVTLSGSGFFPGAAVTITAFGTSNTVSLTVVSTSSGTFSTTLTVPLGVPNGTYTVTATDSTGRGGSTQVTVTSTSGAIQPSTSSATPGTVITVTGSGFGAGEQVSLSLGVPSSAPYAIEGTIQLFTASSSGTFTAQYVVPSVAPGNYYLLALGQTSRVFVFVPFTVLSTTPAPPPPTPTPTPPSPPPSLPSVNVGSTTTYFSDGYTGTAGSNGKATFTERIVLYNPGSTTASVATTYFVYDPSTQARTKVTESDSVAPGASVVRVVNQDVGDNRFVSARVTSSSNIVAEERIDRVSDTGSTLDNDSSLGSHQLGTTWYFAEGFTGFTFQQYITLFNPGTADAHAQIQYLPSDGSTVAPVPVTVPAQGQMTINVRSQYNHLNPSGSQHISTMVTSDSPIAVDRAMYWGDGAGSGKFGYSLGPGIQAGATSQFFAMLPTSGGSQSFVTVLNPNSSTATVSLRLSDASGSSLASVSATVAAHARYTFVVPNILSGDHGFVSASLQSGSQAVVAEAPRYFGGSPNHGSHPGFVSQGSLGGQQGAQADVNSRGAVLRIFNPGTSVARVQVTLGGSAAGTVVFDGLVAGGGAQLVTLPAGTGPRGVLILSSGSITATLQNGGLGNARAWGGALIS